MVGTIGPVGRGARGQAVWRRMLGAYLAGSVLGGALLGALFGIVGLSLEAVERQFAIAPLWANGVGVALLALFALRDLRVLSFPLPTRHRQVPMSWKFLPGMWSPFVFGFALAAGVFTTIYLASFYGMLVIAVLTRDFLVATLMGVIFAIGRTLPVLVAAYLSRRDVLDLIGRLAAQERLVAGGNAAACALVALVLASAA